MSLSTLQIQTPKAFAPLLQPARYKGIHGGRGSGKSHDRAEALVEKHLLMPTRSVCVREVQKSLSQSVKLLVEDKINSMGVSSQFRILESHIETPNNGIIIFQGMQNHTADSIKSLEGYDVAWVEEAQTLSQRSLDLLRPTIRKEGSELWFTWNPRFPTDPVDMLLRSDNPPPDSIVVRANYMDNPWFPDVLREEMEYDRSRDPDKYAHVWLGEYSLNTEARVFRNWRVEEFETPKDARFRFGADWGFSIDPTVLVRCWLNGRTLYIDHEAWEVGCEIDRTPALFDTIEQSRKWLINADSARPETVSYMRRAGFKISGAIKGPGSIEDGIEFLKSFDIVVHPRCKNVINELIHYSWKIDKHTEEILPVLDDKNNHTIDALRYALEAMRKASPKRNERPSTNPPDLWGRKQGNVNSWKTV